MTNSTSAAPCSNAAEFQNIPLGAFYLVHTLFYYPFYIPCAIVMWRKPNIQMSCYKFIGTLAIIDMGGLIGVGIFPDIWSLSGMTYCDHYWQMKYVGAYIDFMWISYCYLCMSLSINRACDFSSPLWTHRLFEGRKTYYWIGGSLFMGFIYFVAYLTPYASYQYHSGLGVLLFDNDNDLKFGIRMNTFTDCLTPAVLTISYVIVFKHMRKMAAKIEGKQTQAHINSSNNKRRVTLTSVIICIVAGTAALSYPITQVMEVNVTWHMTASHIWWQLTNGSNCFIYLLLNKKIRQSVRVLLKLNNTIEPLSLFALQSQKQLRRATVPRTRHDKTVAHATNKFTGRN